MHLPCTLCYRRSSFDFRIFQQYLAVKIGTPSPLPVNGLLPKAPPIGLNLFASVTLGEQQIDVFWDTLDFNRRYAISGSIVKLFYSILYTLFVRVLSALFKKFPYRDFHTILNFLNSLRVRPPPPITANCR